MNQVIERAARKAVESLKHFRLTNMADEEGDGYPLIDLLSTDGGTVATGYEQLEEIAIVAVQAILRSFLPPEEGMVEAGEAVLAKADEDMRNYVSGITKDWDYGMEAEAVFITMVRRALGEGK